MVITVENGFATVVEDRDNRAVAFVDVTTTPRGESCEKHLQDQLARYPVRVDFVLAVDLQSIRVYRVKGTNVEGPIVCLDTPQILSHYDATFSHKRIFDFYLTTLAEAWLRDLAYRWKSANPPAAEELRNVGFLEKIDGGTTQGLED